MRRIILIVDDNAACLEPLQIALESLEHLEVAVARDAKTALTILLRAPERMGAVITDFRMPAMGGLELLDAMKGHAALRKIPVVVISGDTEPGLPARALESGAVAFFSKPYSPLEVKQRLEQLLA